MFWTVKLLSIFKKNSKLKLTFDAKNLFIRDAAPEIRPLGVEAHRKANAAIHGIQIINGGNFRICTVIKMM